jgi:SAM-dependent methyltransferase
MSDSASREPTERFSERVGHFMRHRPDYPEAALKYLEARDVLGVGAKVADMGSGTGIFSEQLIGRGCEVWAIEPNSPMRSVAEATLEARRSFHSIAAEAEQTPLEEGSVDLVIAAQAFHWFDLEPAVEEFRRISSPPHELALLWNLRKTDVDAFHEDLEAFLRTHGIDYDETVERVETRIDELPDVFGGPEGEAFEHETFEYEQALDFEGFEGLLLSYSYLPLPGDDGYEAMADDLEELFETHAEEGEVHLQYDTEVYVGTLS